MGLVSCIQNYVMEHPKIGDYLVKGSLISTALVTSLTSVAGLTGCQTEPEKPTPLPDLAFGTVNYVEGKWNDIEGGRNYRIELYIGNIGEEASGLFAISVSGLEQKLMASNIEPGNTLPVAFDLNLPAGKQSININLDPENKVNEKDEGNNYHKLTIDVPKPPFFELIGDNLTAEQYKTFHDNALEDYLKVLDVYGMNKEDARIKFIVGQERYSINFFFNDNPVGGAVGIGHDDFITDRREVKHETAHAVNHGLFPTYHMWFDEGVANYTQAVDDFYSGHKGYKELKSDPEFWEKRKVNYGPDSSNVPTHLIGSLFFLGLIQDYDLTPEKHRTAINTMHQMYLKTNQQLSKKDIEYAYETALGVSLDPLFNLIGDGVKTLYGLYASPSKDMAKTMNEF